LVHGSGDGRAVVEERELGTDMVWIRRLGRCRQLAEQALHSGLAITPLAVTFLIGSIVTPRLFARYGRRVLLVGGLIQALAVAFLTVIVVEKWPHVALPELAPSAVSGLGGPVIFVSISSASSSATFRFTLPGSVAGRW
jgi:MFS family permease